MTCISHKNQIILFICMFTSGWFEKGGLVYVLHLYWNLMKSKFPISMVDYVVTNTLLIHSCCVHVLYNFTIYHLFGMLLSLNLKLAQHILYEITVVHSLTHHSPAHSLPPSLIYLFIFRTTSPCQGHGGSGACPRNTGCEAEIHM